MDKIKIHVLRTGEVRVSPYLPFGGDNCSIIKASGLTTPKKDWIWLPVFSYLIEHPKGLILFDTGWHRDMSPDGSLTMVNIPGHSEGLCALKIRNVKASTCCSLLMAAMPPSRGAT